MKASHAAVWAISDLHLSFAREDRRERFAERWRDHAQTIATEWRAVVERDDVVVIPGDISMARNHREVQPDLAWLDKLPGTKVLSPGNHDGWWNVLAKVRPILRKSQLAVDGDAVEVNGVIVCGTRSAATLAEDAAGTSKLPAEVGKLRSALDAAKLLQAAGTKPIVALWHHPPFDPQGAPGPAVELIASAGVTACVYGHLHTQAQWERAVQGEHGDVLYRCVAADALGFRPLRIL